MREEVGTLLPNLACLGCGGTLSGRWSPAASSFATCARRCEACGVGFSNGLANPTVIYRDPLQNTPWQARDGALRALGESINIRSRGSKIHRFGFETSEDALTWTMFSYLASEPLLMDRVLNHFGVTDSLDGKPAVLLWGSPVGRAPEGANTRERLIHVSDSLGENPASRSEPDVLVDLGSAGLVVIEVKYRSANDNKSDTGAFDRYLDERFFLDAAAVKATGMYELARNWRIGSELAQGRPFTLVNLVLAPTLNADRNRLERFSSALRTGEQAQFTVIEWSTLIEAVGRLMPPWLTEYLDQRLIPRSRRG